MRTLVLAVALTIPSFALAHHDEVIDQQGGHTGVDGKYHCHTAACTAATGAANEGAPPSTAAVPVPAKAKAADKGNVQPAKAKPTAEK